MSEIKKRVEQELVAMIEETIKGMGCGQLTQSTIRRMGTKLSGAFDLAKSIIQSEGETINTELRSTCLITVRNAQEFNKR